MWWERCQRDLGVGHLLCGTSVNPFYGHTPNHWTTRPQPLNGPTAYQHHYTENQAPGIRMGVEKKSTSKPQGLQFESETPPQAHVLNILSLIGGNIFRRFWKIGRRQVIFFFPRVSPRRFIYAHFLSTSTLMRRALPHLYLHNRTSGLRICLGQLVCLASGLLSPLLRELTATKHPAGHPECRQ